MVELEITGSAFEGTSVARLDGFVVFVEGGVPGDRVRAQVQKAKKDYATARILALLHPSPFRTQPRCPYFGTCGGCRWQHVAYEHQLRFKEQHVRELFERVGGFINPPILPIVGATDIYFYRNKMEYSFSDREWKMLPPESATQFPSSTEPPNHAGTPSPVFLGLHVPERYDKVLDIRECHLQSDVSNRILNATREFAVENALDVYSSERHAGYLRFLVIRQSKRTEELMVNIVTFDDRPQVMVRFARFLNERVRGITTMVNTINRRKAQIAYGEEEKTYVGDGIIHEQIGGLMFTVSAGSFFQSNTPQAEELYRIAAEFAGLQPADVVYDLYSGTGTIALLISRRVKSVIGVESIPAAVDDAQRNAEANGITNCSFVQSDLLEYLRRFPSDPGVERPDVVIVDPPRSGMHPEVVGKLIEVGSPRLVYIGCNPATQARDAKLLAAGGYELVNMRPVDLFPQTYHIENVALFRRPPSSP